MEPEDNAITIPFTGDTFVSDYIITNTLNVDGTFLTYTGGGGEWEPQVNNYRDNVDNKIVIPYAFEKVVKKSIEGLEDVRVFEYESYKNTNYNTLVSDDTIFYLHVELKISWDVKQLYTKKDYTEKINHLFKMTYPNNNSYKFEVKHVIGGEHDEHKDFFEFFSR
jgi:hypothetical protein